MAGGKYRSFLVHIKAVSDKGMEENPRPVVRMPTKPQSSKAQSLSSLLQRAQASKVQYAPSNRAHCRGMLSFGLSSSSWDTQASHYSSLEGAAGLCSSSINMQAWLERIFLVLCTRQMGVMSWS